MTKSKQNPSRARPKPNGRAKGAGVPPKRTPTPKTRINNTHKTEVCGLTDPFCDHALSAKYHDTGSVRSLPLPRKSRYVLTTNAAGSASILIVPSYLYSDVTYADTLVGDTATFWGVARSAVSAPEAASVRLVSYGVIVRSIVAPLSASGMVRVRGFSSIKEPVTLASSVLMSTYNADFSADQPLHATKELAVIARKIDDKAKFFKPPNDLDPSNLVAANTGTGFSQIMISVTGGPASAAALDVELVCHWEITLIDSDPIQQITTSSRPQNLIVEAASRAISTSSQNIFTAGISAASSYIERYAIQAISSLTGTSAALLL